MMSNSDGSDWRRDFSGAAARLASRALLAIALLAVPMAGSLADGVDSDEDARCLKCHSRNLKKTLGDGGKMSLQVEAAAFEGSVHATTGCTGCHREISSGTHPSREPVSNRRDYAIEQNRVCQRCHAANFEQYSGSIHASLVADGHPDAPLCSDCHSAHEVQSTAHYEPLTGEPCKTCHQGIFEAYATSVHGRARSEGNVIRASHIEAPICVDCHQAHDVAAVATGETLKSTCLACHEGAAAAHEAWLPNAGLHLDAVACPACHSPEAERRIDLQLYDKLAQVPVTQGEGEEAARPFADVDTGGDGLDPVELWRLVRRTSHEGGVTEVVLRGRMEVSTGPDAHRLAIKDSATRDCANCHQGGSEPFRNVTVSISRPDGRKKRVEADSRVLSSVVSVDSVGDFYAPGGTRIRLLDGLFALAVIGGLAIPIGHFTLGRFVRKKERGAARRSGPDIWRKENESD